MCPSRAPCIHRATLARALQKLKQRSVIFAFTTRKVQIGNWSLPLSLAGR